MRALLAISVIALGLAISGPQPATAHVPPSCIALMKQVDQSAKERIRELQNLTVKSNQGDVVGLIDGMSALMVNDGRFFKLLADWTLCVGTR